MKRLSLTAVSLAVLSFGVGAFHPGVANADPVRSKGAASVFTEEATFKIDSMHAHIGFEINHLGLSEVHGRFDKFEGTIHEDPADLTKSRVEFSAEVASINTAVPMRDQDLRSERYFSAEQYPTMTFKSSKVSRNGEGYTVTGELTLRGKSKEVTIPFKHYGPIKAGPQERIGVVAEPIKIKRSDFGVGSMEKMPNGTLPLSDEVIVRISFEAIKAE
ncbi:MAG: YceI family protein [Fimbriimonadaceae bacterium]|nr:YceI family protein [Fimbriimonadaceae bacterium]QYK55523.1 MAG: YceI family protein [Fimbriimonadaceae bacterium]